MNSTLVYRTSCPLTRNSFVVIKKTLNLMHFSNKTKLWFEAHGLCLTGWWQTFSLRTQPFHWKHRRNESWRMKIKTFFFWTRAQEPCLSTVYVVKISSEIYTYIYKHTYIYIFAIVSRLSWKSSCTHDIHRRIDPKP